MDQQWKFRKTEVVYKFVWWRVKPVKIELALKIINMILISKLVWIEYICMENNLEL